MGKLYPELKLSNNALVACKLFSAQRQDCKSFEELQKALPWNNIKYLVADKGYDPSNVRNIIKSYGAIPFIPFKGVYLPECSELTPEDFYDVKLYKKRNIIERFFGRLKENKRIAMRFDKMDHSFSSFIVLAIAKLFKLLLLTVPSTCEQNFWAILGFCIANLSILCLTYLHAIFGLKSRLWFVVIPV